MKKMIFLDIDGVLNNESFHEKWMDEHDTPCESYEDSKWQDSFLEKLFSSRYIEVSDIQFYNGYIVPENLENFNRIIDATNADVVLSSDWRFINDGNYNNVADIDIIKQMFRIREIKGNVIGATPYIFKNPRNIEILRYIKSNNIQDTKIVVIDDLREAGEAISGIPDTLFIWTDYVKGLTKEEANEVIEFLNKGE